MLVVMKLVTKLQSFDVNMHYISIGIGYQAKGLVRLRYQVYLANISALLVDCI